MKSLSILIAMFVSFCVLSIEAEPDWNNRFKEIKQEELKKFQSPKKGDKINIKPSIGGEVSGVVMSIDSKSISINGQKFLFEELSNKTRDLISAEYHAEQVAKKTVQKERLEYKKKKSEEDDKIAKEKTEKEIADKKAKQEQIDKENAETEAALKQLKISSSETSNTTKSTSINDLDKFMEVLRVAEVREVDSCSVNGNTLSIFVKNIWHYQPYQIRLQAAQNLWKAWARIHSPDNLDASKIKIKDQNGNTVGSSGFMFGSSISVNK